MSAKVQRRVAKLICIITIEAMQSWRKCVSVGALSACLPVCVFVCLSTHIIIGNGHWAPATATAAAAHKQNRAKLVDWWIQFADAGGGDVKNSGKISGPKTAKLMQSSAPAAAAAAVASVFQQSVIS